MTYYVLGAYTYLFGNFFIYTYNILIPLPIYKYQYGYIGVMCIHTNTYHKNTYKNTYM